jgi:cytochrome c553
MSAIALILAFASAATPWPISLCHAADPAQAASGGAEAPTSAHAPAGHAHAGHHHGATADMAAPLPFGLLGDVRDGEALYRQNCASCHGESGDGAGPLARSMNPRPADFTSAAARTTLARPHLFDAIGKGISDNGMPAWERVLTPQQIADLAEYVFVSFVRAEPAAAK